MHHVVFGAGLLLRTGPAVRGDIENDPGQVGMLHLIPIRVVRITHVLCRIPVFEKSPPVTAKVEKTMILVAVQISLVVAIALVVFWLFKWEGESDLLHSNLGEASAAMMNDYDGRLY